MSIKTIRYYDRTPVLSTGDVCRALDMVVSVKQLKALGFQPIVETSTGSYWPQADLPRVARALARHYTNLAEQLEREPWPAATERT